MKWLKNSNGTPDSMLSFAFGGFIVTCLAVIISFLGKISIGDFSFEFSELDASHVALVTMFLGATLTAYINRRNTKDKHAAKIEELKLRAKLGFSDSEEESEE